MDIETVEFGILSSKDVLDISVCEIKFDKQKKLDDASHTLYDPRMGPSEDDKVCPTCQGNMIECPGHFGHIVLNAHVVYPLPIGFNTVLNFLKCFCFECSRFAFTEEKLQLLGLADQVGPKRYAEIVLAIEKVDICCHCNKLMAKFLISDRHTDPKIEYYHEVMTNKKASKDRSEILSVDQIDRVFSKITDDDLRLFGFDPKRMHPKDLVLSIIPVLPLCSRPCAMSNGEKHEDDLTIMYRDIIKANNKIAACTKEKERQPLINSLSFYISVLMDNSKGRVKQTNGRAKKGIKERLAHKEGVVRGSLLGKRTNSSGRTVVGPDTELAADEISVPDCIATKVTIPELVTVYNLEKLTKIVNTGQAEFVKRIDLETGLSRKINLSIAMRNKTTPLYHGDIVTRIVTTPKVGDTITRNDGGKIKITAEFHESMKPRDGDVVTRVIFVDDIALLRAGDIITRKDDGEQVKVEINTKPFFQLKIGDKVRRHLQDGDWVILNRQPTLHVGSMLAVRVKRAPGRRSIGIPLNLTTPQNMDFDGDEANIYVPQTIEAMAELRELINVQNNIITSRPIMGIVQDCMLGAYLMTQGWVTMEVHRFNDICVAANLNIDRIDQIKNFYEELFGDASKVYTGRGLISMIFDRTFSYTLENKAVDGEPILKIRHGTIIEGGLNKSAIGPRSGAIHHYMTPKKGLEFLTVMQRVINGWMAQRGFSIGIKDCLPLVSNNEGAIPQVSDYIQKCFLRAGIAESTQSNPAISERMINSALNAARDVGQKIAKESLDKRNRFLDLIQSGSKGSIANLTQITGLLGQQNLGGKRLELSCIDGKRTLPHYLEENETLEKRFEAQGFVKSSFVAGLNPQEFWSHAQSSREGIISTACTTAKTGYSQRRITEYLKNLRVQYDYSVRNSNGRIVQFVYGSDGIAPNREHRVDGSMQCSLGPLIERLNTEHEIESYDSERKIDLFMIEHGLTIQIPEDKMDDMSPINSASASDEESPSSAVSNASVDYD